MEAKWAGMQATFVRGWVDTLVVGYLSEERALALARPPALRLLRRLEIEEPDYFPDPFAILAKTSGLSNIRELLVSNCGDHHVHKLIANLPRIEVLELGDIDGVTKVFRLPNLGNLRALCIEDAENYPLKDLAANSSLVAWSAWCSVRWPTEVA